MKINCKIFLTYFEIIKKGVQPHYQLHSFTDTSPHFVKNVRGLLSKIVAIDNLLFLPSLFQVDFLLDIAKWNFVQYNRLCD